MEFNAATFISVLNNLPPWLRASAALAVSAVATLMLVRLLRVRSRRIRSAAWMLVLVQGCVFWTWPASLSIRTSAAAVPSALRAAPGTIQGMPQRVPNTATASVRGSNPMDTGETHSSSHASSDSVAGDLSVPTTLSMSLPSVTWQTLLTAGWLLGIVTVCIRAWRSRRQFVAAMSQCEPVPEEWLEDFGIAVEQMQLRRPPSMAVHPTIGPCLTWRRFRHLIIVPRELWSGLSHDERRLILRHELAHARRGDLWTALAGRCIAACHWFNPCAWLACRRLEECAEWACDDDACAGDDAATMTYSRLLLHLRLTGRVPASSAAMARPDTVAARVRRLLDAGDRESIVRRGCFAVIVLTAMSLVRVELRLAAEEPSRGAAASNTTASNTTAAADQAIEAVPIFDLKTPPVPGRPRPEGLLSMIGDERAAMSGNYPMRLVLTTDGRRLFAIHSSDVIDVFDTRTLKLTECIRSRGSRVLEASPSPDGKRLVVSSLDGSLRIWDVTATPATVVSESFPFGMESKEVWTNLSASMDRHRFCVSGKQRVAVFEWTDEGLRTIFEQAGANEWRPAVLSPNGRRLVIRHKDPELSLWNLGVEPAVEIDRLAMEDRFVAPVVWKNEEILIVSHGTENDRYIQQILCTDEHMELRGKHMSGYDIGVLFSPAFLDDGQLCVVNVNGPHPSLVDSSGDDWTIQQPFPFPGERLRATAASPDGLTLYAAVDGVLESWDRKGNTFVPRDDSAGRSHAVAARAPRFLGDGTTLLADMGDTVRMFATEDPGRPREVGCLAVGGVSHIERHPLAGEAVLLSMENRGAVTTVSCAPSGLKQIASVEFGDGNKDTAWKDAPWCAGYSPDGKTVAVGFWNRSINLYRNTPTGLELASEYPRIASLHVCVLTFSPDGKRLACGDFGHQLKLFAVDGDALTLEKSLSDHGEAVRHAVFTPDGRTLISGSQNGEIRVTDLSVNPPTERLLLFPGQAPPGKSEFEASIISLELVADGRLLMTSCAWKGGSRIGLWSMPAGELLQSWEFSGWDPATITPKGNLLAVARSDGTLCLLDVGRDVATYLEAP